MRPLCWMAILRLLRPTRLLTFIRKRQVCTPATTELFVWATKSHIYAFVDPILVFFADLAGRCNAQVYQTNNSGCTVMISPGQKSHIYLFLFTGFTAWSSRRTPAEVFELLEALYSAFDAVALRRKVFKVETVSAALITVLGGWIFFAHAS